MTTTEKIKLEIKEKEIQLKGLSDDDYRVDNLCVDIGMLKAELKGFQAGENSKHKSDLQQELTKRERENHQLMAIILSMNTMRIKVGVEQLINLQGEFQERINLIKKELEGIENVQ